MLTIWPIPVFTDNYVWVLQRDALARVAVVDPGDGLAVEAALAARGLTPSAVLVTHHHADHVGGVDELRERHELPVFGPAAERIPAVDRAVSGGDVVEIADLDLELAVLDVPGHTAGHIAYLGSDFVLCGDTLFAGGCGRVFEGTPEQMFASLGRLARLPAATRAYCAHEYTLANLRFACQVEPDNQLLQQRLAATSAARADDRPTVPSTIAEELRTNPFLRCDEPAVRHAAADRAGGPLAGPSQVFAVIRAWKDTWQG